MVATKKRTQNAREQNPRHDEGYKDVLSNSVVFLQFLRKYFAAESWTKDISPDDLEHIDKSFVTSEYKHLDSDLIYKLKIKNSDVYFYILFELQSKVDFTMPFRLLRYMVELLNVIFKNTDENVRNRKGFRLPAIVPIVLYNGKNNWTAAMRYSDYTKGSGIFKHHIIDFQYLMFDLNRMNEDAIEPVENPLDAIFVVEKLRINKKLTADKLLAWWTEKTVKLSKKDKDSLIKWIDHVYFKGKMSPETKKILKNNPQKGDIAMKSLIDEWAEKAERKAEKRKTLEIAKNLRANGVDAKTIAKSTGLAMDAVLRF